MDTLTTLSIMDRVLLLRRVHLLDDLSPEELQRVAAISTELDFVDGEVFDLFDAASFSGSFANVTLPALPPDRSWDLSRLAVDGSIRIGPRLAIGWAMGTVVTAVAIYLSLKVDLPTGATIVCTFGIVLILMAVVRVLVQRTPANHHADGR